MSEAITCVRPEADERKESEPVSKSLYPPTMNQGIINPKEGERDNYEVVYQPEGR